MWLKRHSDSGLPDFNKARAPNPAPPPRASQPCRMLSGSPKSPGVACAQARWRDVGTCSWKGEDVAMWKSFQEEGRSRAKA